MQLVILGSGSATPTLYRNPSSQWLRMHGIDMLIDCGEGTQMQMLRFHLKINKISAIFISHLHGDHYLGLPGLISSMHLTGRTSPLVVYGPGPLEEIIRLQFEVSNTFLGFELSFIVTDHETPQNLVEFSGFNVDTFPLKHRIPCTGFKFTEKQRPRNIRTDALRKYRIPVNQLAAIKDGKDFTQADGSIIANIEVTEPPKPLVSYAYCSDTSPFEELKQYISGATWLYHEATFAQAMAERARETFHSTAAEAAETAKSAEVKKLLLGHFSARYQDIQTLTDEARAVFAETLAVSDGMEIALTPF